MEAFVANKVADYQQGRISRRQLIESLTVAAATAYTAEGAKAAAADPTLKIALVNHVSYTCPNFKQAADWYSKMFNLDQIGETKNDVALPFGKKGDKPYGVAANDVPLTHLIIRSRDSLQTRERYLAVSEAVMRLGRGLAIGDADINLHTLLLARKRL